jgi:hypothetical protein
LIQAREAIRQTVEDNPTALRLSRTVTVDNGAGVMVPDPFGDRTVFDGRGRIAPLPYGSRVASPEATVPGVGIPERQFVLTIWDMDIREGDQLEYNGFVWAIGPVAEIYRFGGVVGKQAPIKKAGTV